MKKNMVINEYLDIVVDAAIIKYDIEHVELKKYGTICTGKSNRPKYY